MEQLETLRRLASAASTVRDIAFEKRTFHFQVQPPVALYLHVEYTQVMIARHDDMTIIAQADLQAGFGWRVQTEQDEAGVYLVAKRRTLVGNLSRAQFHITVPQSTHLILRLETSTLALEDITGTLHLPPPADDGTLSLDSARLTTGDS